MACHLTEWLTSLWHLCHCCTVSIKKKKKIKFLWSYYDLLLYHGPNNNSSHVLTGLRSTLFLWGVTETLPRSILSVSLISITLVGQLHSFWSHPLHIHLYLGFMGIMVSCLTPAFWLIKKTKQNKTNTKTCSHTTVINFYLDAIILLCRLY